MSEAELYRAAALILVAALGTLGVYLGKRIPAKSDPEQSKRENFESMVEAMSKLLDRKDAEIADCKEEHRLECVEVNATIKGLEERLQVRRDNEHRLNNLIMVLQLELDACKRGLPPPGDENGNPQ